MTLVAGARLGPYEVLTPLGAGGMGEVYRARDTRLGRDVAIKALPAEFAQDAERLARFRREAQLLAALNHPHIAAIHGLEELDGSQLLVLELVEGEDLAQRLSRGAIPVDEALDIARQIAEALEDAHEHGIVHRDLKPANIKLTPDGKVKVLDFGLAKAYAGDGGSASIPDASHSPTMTRAGTQAGVILGTAAYMSPEQARGRPVDRRADIWAFGVVLFEMLTGERLFHGETVSDTLAAVLKVEPDLSRVPIAVRRLLQACLQKDPRRRLRAVGDAWLLLNDAPAAASVARQGAAWLVAGMFALLAGLATWVAWRPAASQAPPAAIRLDLDLGAAVVPTSIGADLILSPDGTRLVFVAQRSKGKSQLLTRRLDQSQAVELPGTEGAYGPFFSPDGEWVAFFAGGKLKKVALDGGEPVILCAAPAGRGGTWGEDGNIVASLATQMGRSLVPAAGGKVVPLTSLAPGENSHRWPQHLPGGKLVLFTSNKTYANFDEATISVVSLADRKWRPVLEGSGMYPRYLPSGYVIFVTRGTLFAVPFDAATGEVRGRSAAVVEDVSNDNTFGFARLDASANGVLLYRRGRTESARTVQWMDSGGKLEPLAIEPAIYQFPRVSPDGNRVIWMMNEGPVADLWIYDSRRGTRTRLTDGKNAYMNPVWSPDGNHVVFSSSQRMLWTRADGAGSAEYLIASERNMFPTSFTPDGRRLTFSELNPNGALIQTVLVEESAGRLRAGKPDVFLATSSSLPFAAFSPDSRWLAYTDAESGSHEVCVRAFPDRGTRWLISNDGGTMPLWSKNGRELFYRNDENRIMVVAYTVKGDDFVAEKARVWSERQLANTGLTPNFDLAPDGKRFVVLMPAAGSEPLPAQSHVTLVMNFLDELRRLAPAE